jgi:hypothetical protein
MGNFRERVPSETATERYDKKSGHCPDFLLELYRRISGFIGGRSHFVPRRYSERPLPRPRPVCADRDLTTKKAAPRGPVQLTLACFLSDPFAPSASCASRTDLSRRGRWQKGRAAIENRLQTLANYDREWRLLFARNGIVPLSLAYEGIREDLPGALRKIVAYAKIALPSYEFVYGEPQPIEFRGPDEPSKSVMREWFTQPKQR